MNKEELIKKYKHGTLDEEAQKEFETLLAEEEAFAKAVAEYESVQKAIAAHERENLKQHLQSLEDTSKTTKKSNTSYRKLAIAAVFVLFLGLIGNYFLQTSNTNETLYATYFEPYPNALAPVIRGEEAMTDLQNALYLYEIQEYEDAYHALNKLSQTADSQQANIQFYKAMSLLNLDQTAEASRLLSELKSSDTRFMPQVYWYSALIALKRDRISEAVKDLKYMQQLQTDYKQKDRERLLKTLQE